MHNFYIAVAHQHLVKQRTSQLFIVDNHYSDHFHTLDLLAGQC